MPSNCTITGAEAALRTPRAQYYARGLSCPVSRTFGRYADREVAAIRRHFSRSHIRLLDARYPYGSPLLRLTLVSTRARHPRKGVRNPVLPRDRTGSGFFRLRVRDFQPSGLPTNTPALRQAAPPFNRTAYSPSPIRYFDSVGIVSSMTSLDQSLIPPP